MKNTLHIVDAAPGFVKTSLDLVDFALKKMSVPPGVVDNTLNLVDTTHGFPGPSLKNLHLVMVQLCPR